MFLRGADGEAVRVLLETVGADGESIARFLPQLDAAPFASLTQAAASAACVIAPHSGPGLASLGAVLGGVGLLAAAYDSIAGFDKLTTNGENRFVLSLSKDGRPGQCVQTPHNRSLTLARTESRFCAPVRHN